MAKRKMAAAPRSASPRKRTVKVAAAPTHDEIAEAAYHRYLKRGSGDGADFDDWVEAEKELRGKKKR
jgi:hypothetical protein